MTLNDVGLINFDTAVEYFSNSSDSLFPSSIYAFELRGLSIITMNLTLYITFGIVWRVHYNCCKADGIRPTKEIEYPEFL